MTAYHDTGNCISYPHQFVMARAHRYAIDYIEQAPVIVLAARTSAVFDFYIRPKMLEATERPTLPGSVCAVHFVFRTNPVAISEPIVAIHPAS
jgi:hypothetical protein